MAQESTSDITQLLRAWESGDQAALPQLMTLLHVELHALAHRHMARESPGHALQTTALVNELYLRLVDVHGIEWRNRQHFKALCARLMRRVLVEIARSRSAAKRQGAAPHIGLTAAADLAVSDESDIIAVEDALERLARLDARKAQVVELRFYGGLTIEEAAAFLEVSPETVMRDWAMARAWLSQELGGSTGS